MPTFNWEINVGSLIALLALAGVGYKFYFGTNTALVNFGNALEAGMARLDKNIETMNKVVMDLALSSQRQDNFEKRTDDRFKHLEDDFREMKHGKGFVNS